MGGLEGGGHRGHDHHRPTSQQYLDTVAFWGAPTSPQYPDTVGVLGCAGPLLRPWALNPLYRPPSPSTHLHLNPPTYVAVGWAGQGWGSQGGWWEGGWVWWWEEGRELERGGHRGHDRNHHHSHHDHHDQHDLLEVMPVLVQALVLWCLVGWRLTSL